MTRIRFILISNYMKITDRESLKQNHLAHTEYQFRHSQKSVKKKRLRKIKKIFQEKALKSTQFVLIQ